MSHDSGWCLEGRKMGQSITPRGAVSAEKSAPSWPVLEVGWVRNDSFSEVGCGEKTRPIVVLCPWK